MKRLQAQTDFLLTCDRLKSVTRQNRLHDGSRDENSAEHSWHLALMALTLGEYAPADTDLSHVVRLLVTHDLVEIYAGDAYFELPDAEMALHTLKERQAAVKLFAQLPPEQGAAFMAWWEEFEARQTPEARFAKALDALQPMLMTWGTGGKGSTYLDLTAERVLRRKHPYIAEFPALWELVERTVAEAVAAGIMPTERVVSAAED
jgi:putative hydrolases of HD superfamily